MNHLTSTLTTFRCIVFITAGFFCLSAPATGQGWLKNYTSIPQYIDHQVVATPGGYTALLTNKHDIVHYAIFKTTQDGTLTDTTYYNYQEDADAWYAPVSDGSCIIAWRQGTTILNLKKRGPSGAVLWTKAIAFPAGTSEIVDLAMTETGVIFACLSNWIGDSPDRKISTIKFDANGNQLWEQSDTPPGPSTDQQSYQGFLTPASDGGCFRYFTHGGVYFIQKISAAGDLLWTTNPDLGSWTSLFHHFTETPDGGLIFSGTVYGALPINTIAFRLDNQGQILWNRSIIDIWPSDIFNLANVTSSGDGGVLVTGLAYQANGSYNSPFIRLDQAGNLKWAKTIQEFEYSPFLPPGPFGGTLTADGGYVFCGNWEQTVMFKIDSLGNLHPNTVQGTVAGDLNLNCMVEPTDIPLPNSVLKASKNGQSFYLFTLADSLGQYAVQADTGNYTIQLQNPGYLWEPCADSVVVNLPAVGMTATADFPLQPLAECPLMTIELYTPSLVRCFQNTFHVQYCNIGSAMAAGASVKITLDPGLVFNASSIPGTQNGQIVTFPLGNIAPGGCGNFTFQCTPSCDSTQLGETKCITAHITPDTICAVASTWSGANIVASASCAGDSVRFYLKNTGPVSSSNLDYVIIDDHVIMFQGNFQLGPGGQKSVGAMANGHTYRIIAQQEPGNPVGNMPNVGIEACGPGQPSQGIISQFPNQTGSPFDAIVCKTIVGSFDPNDKKAAPEGIGPAHFIENGTELEYQIDFQNTGNAMATRVIVLDTLPSALDLLTIKGIGASHLYNLKTWGDHVVQFTFDNINLPDSGANPAASHGFLRFKITPHNDLPDGTLILNKAAIYFDYNKPVITNSVFHTIGHDFLTSGTGEPAALPYAGGLTIMPNPAEDHAVVLLENDAIRSGTYRVVNAFGRIVASGEFNGPAFNLLRGNLDSGIYIVEVWSDSAAAGVGKVCWR